MTIGMKSKLVYELITYENLEIACSIQNEIFPDEFAKSAHKLYKSRDLIEELYTKR